LTLLLFNCNRKALHLPGISENFTIFLIFFAKSSSFHDTEPAEIKPIAHYRKYQPNTGKLSLSQFPKIHPIGANLCLIFLLNLTLFRVTIPKKTTLPKSFPF